MSRRKEKLVIEAASSSVEEGRGEIAVVEASNAPSGQGLRRLGRGGRSSGFPEDFGEDFGPAAN
jgi:hypothetical protein